jgi:hypothetical protein
MYSIYAWIKQTCSVRLASWRNCSHTSSRNCQFLYTRYVSRDVKALRVLQNDYFNRFWTQKSVLFSSQDLCGSLKGSANRDKRSCLTNTKSVSLRGWMHYLKTERQPTIVGKLGDVSLQPASWIHRLPIMHWKTCWRVFLVTVPTIDKLGSESSGMYSRVLRSLSIIALMMEAACTSEMSVDNYFTRQYIPEDKSKLHTCCRENLKAHK